MVAPAKAVFRPSGLFLIKMTKQLFRGLFWGKVCKKGGFLDKLKMLYDKLIWPPDEAPYKGKKEVVNSKTDNDERNLH